MVALSSAASPRHQALLMAFSDDLLLSFSSRSTFDVSAGTQRRIRANGGGLLFSGLNGDEKGRNVRVAVSLIEHDASLIQRLTFNWDTTRLLYMFQAIVYLEPPLQASEPPVQPLEPGGSR